MEGQLISFSRLVTVGRERCMRQCVGNSSLYPSNHRMTLIVLIASYWNNPRVPQGNFPDVLSRNPLLVIVVNCSFVRMAGVQKVVQNSRAEQRYTNETFVVPDVFSVFVCLAIPAVRSFVFRTYKRCDIHSDYVWWQLTKRRLGTSNEFALLSFRNTFGHLQ